MKCKDFEREIYLYRELAEAEREVLDNHLAGCEQCSTLLAMIQQTGALISKTSSLKPEPENAARLTGNIMQEIVSRQKQNSSWINNMILRYTMAATSFVIIFTFGVESFSSVEPISKRFASSKPVTLNSSSFAKYYREKKEQPEKPSLYACVKNGACKTLIENFKKEL